MKDFVIYHNYVPKVGGIESAVYNLAKVMDLEGYKVTVLFRGAESYQSLLKYAQVADVVKVTDDFSMQCSVALIASNHDIPKGLEAEKYLQWVHSDYDKYKLDLKNKGKVRYVAVSKHCAKIIKKREGVDCDVIYNIVDPDFGKDKRKVLRLVTNSRVSPEKGFGRMLQFAELLKANNIRFTWVVYGDNSHIVKEYTDWINKFKHIEEVQFVGFKQDVTIGLTNADYLVQLSDFEGCPYAILEALSMGVPCIVTNWGGVEELVQDGVNGYVLPMDMVISSSTVKKIVKEIPKVEYKPLSTAKDWIKLIGK